MRKGIPLFSLPVIGICVILSRMGSTVLALVTARGGSKGIPGKNIACVCGKPLIAWTIEASHAAKRVTRTIVSTDDPAIAAAARDAGAEIPFMRPPELAQDNTPHIDVLVHALQWVKQNESRLPDYLLLLQPTSPLREGSDIDVAIELAECHSADSVIGVSACEKHPYWMKTREADGRLRNFLPDVEMGTHRQHLPPVYAVNGALYLARPELLLKQRTFYSDKTYGYVMPRERSVDIDEPIDLKLCDLLLRERQRANV